MLAVLLSGISAVAALVVLILILLLLSPTDVPPISDLLHARAIQILVKFPHGQLSTFVFVQGIPLESFSSLLW